MSSKKTTRYALALAVWLPVAPAFAEGPLNVGGPSDAEGVPFRWNPVNFPLQYWTDQGSLGTRTNAQANTLVSGAFTTWANVETSNITFIQSAALGGDVTALNFDQVEQDLNNCSNPTSEPPGGVAKPRSIIYDTDGSIMDHVYGVGQSDFTLGFAYATCLTSDGTNNFYHRGLAVMNGKGTTNAALNAVMVHEFGHMLGLDHSQINLECLYTFCSTEAMAGLPTMFPILVDDAAMSSLATDDIAGISVLHPETVNNPGSGRVPFASTTGVISGLIYFSDGQTQAQNLNVIARIVDNPLTATDESMTTAVSNVSGFLFTADDGNPIVPYPGFSPSLNGSRDENLIGYYEIPGLPPGNYTVEVEAIDPDFTAGSGVGPVGYLGIVFPMPSIVCPDGEFHNTAEDNNDVCTDSTSVPVTAGIETQDKNIILNGTPPRYDAWEDGP